MSFKNFITSFGKSTVKYTIEDWDGRKTTSNFVENHTHVYTCVSIISNNFSKLSLNVKKDGKIQENHPLQYLLNHRFNGYQNKQSILSMLELDRNTSGNSYLWRESDDSFRIIPSDLVHNYKIEGGKITYYVNNVSDMQYKDEFPSEIDGKDILHFRHVTTGVVGLSPITAAYSSTEMLNNATNIINNSYKNGIHSSYALESEIPTNDKGAIVADKSRNDFKDKFVGVRNAGEIIRLPFGHKLTPLAVKLVDYEIINSIKFSRDSICSVFQIPNSYLNEQDSSKNIEQDTLMFKTMCISPIANIYEQELMFKLLSEQEVKAGYTIEFNLDKLVEVDTASKISIYKDAIRNGMISPYDVSKILGFPNDSEEAKKIRLEAQLYPIEEFEKYNPLLKDDPTAKGATDNKFKEKKEDDV